MNSTTKAHLALFATNVFFAINYSSIKELIHAELIEAFGLNLLRIAVPTALLWILFACKPQKTYVQKSDYGRFILCALTGIALNQLLFIKGLSLTYSINASLLVLATPVLVSILAAFWLKTPLRPINIIGLALGSTGAVIIIISKSTGGYASNPLLGDTLMVGNAVSNAFYLILVQPLMRKYPPLMVIRMIFTFGLIMILPFCWNEFVAIPWHAYNSTGYAHLFLVIFCGTFLSYVLNVYGIKNLGPRAAGNYIYLQPLFATLIAVYFLGENLTLLKLIAGLCIAVGVYLANKKKYV